MCSWTWPSCPSTPTPITATEPRYTHGRTGRRFAYARTPTAVHIASAQSTSRVAPATSQPDIVPIGIVMAASVRVLPRLAAEPGAERLPPCDRKPGEPLHRNGYASGQDKSDGQGGDHRARHQRRHQPATRSGEHPAEQGPAAGQECLPARRGG